jgi:hypothetical protein
MRPLRSGIQFGHVRVENVGQQETAIRKNDVWRVTYFAPPRRSGQWQPATRKPRSVVATQEFLSQHWELIVAADFFTVEVWTRQGLRCECRARRLSPERFGSNCWRGPPGISATHQCSAYRLPLRFAGKRARADNDCQPTSRPLGSPKQLSHALPPVYIGHQFVVDHCLKDCVCVSPDCSCS